jgi:hypothetical protein
MTNGKTRGQEKYSGLSAGIWRTKWPCFINVFSVFKLQISDRVFPLQVRTCLDPSSCVSATFDVNYYLATLTFYIFLSLHIFSSSSSLSRYVFLSNSILPFSILPLSWLYVRYHQHATSHRQLSLNISFGVSRSNTLDVHAVSWHS